MPAEFVAKATNRAGADVVVVVRTSPHEYAAHCSGCTTDAPGYPYDKEAVTAWAQKHADACSFSAA